MEEILAAIFVFMAFANIYTAILFRKNKTKELVLGNRILIIGSFAAIVICGLLFSVLSSGSEGLNDVFGYYLASLFLAIISIICLIVNVIQSKKIKHKAASKKLNAGSIIPQIIIAALPFMVIAFCVVKDIILFNNAALVLDFNYQNGFVTSTNTRVVVSDNSCTRVNTSISPNAKLDQIEEFHYRVGIGAAQVTDSYEDEELKGIDLNLSERIIADSKKHAGEEIDNDRYCASITKLGSSDFYIINNIMVSKGKNYGCGGQSLGEYVYKNDKFVCELHASGGLKSVFRVLR